MTTTTWSVDLSPVAGLLLTALAKHGAVAHHAASDTFTRW